MLPTGILATRLKSFQFAFAGAVLIGAFTVGGTLTGRGFEGDVVGLVAVASEQLS